ncbi:MAG: class I SAM-dependent methyltransferase [Myxococcota bacterium]
MPDRICEARAMLESEPARGDPAFSTFLRLVQSAEQPLRGSLVIVYRGCAFEFGHAGDAEARVYEVMHRRRLGGRPSLEAVAPQLDGEDPQLGLEVDRDRRFPWPRVVDERPGEWVHPVVLVHSPHFFTRALAERNLGLAEAFIEGGFEMLRGSVHHFIGFMMVNGIDRKVEVGRREKLRLLRQYLSWRWSKSHNEDIADHYDMGDNIMVPMLGKTGVYTCGYLRHETDDLETLQIQKMNLIFSKLRIEPGMRLLDMGCGNGGMLIHAALSWGCHGVGFTNSYNMASLARRNAEHNGVADKITILHADHTVLKTFDSGGFDAVYEVGVWEHLPFSDYPWIMRECMRVQAPHGRMLIHSMGSHQKVHEHDDFIQKYIFKDSNQIRLHLLLDEARKGDMFVADVENIGRHYYWTLWYWRRNLMRAYEEDPTVGKHNFLIMLYFMECGMAESRFGDGSLYHILLFKDPRDYLQTWRVDGRILEPERGEMEDRPFLMKPADLQEHLHNDQNADGKWDSEVYRRPSLRERGRQIYDRLRSAVRG